MECSMRFLTLDRYTDAREITRYELAKRTDIRFHIVDKYHKKEVVRYDSYVLDKICSALDREISDMVKHVK